jgi:peroxiredoxin (alkyl hydroperoxide reductase subunit C)
MIKTVRIFVMALSLGALVLAWAGQALAEKKPVQAKEKDKESTSCVATAKGPLAPGGKSAESAKPAVLSPAAAVNARVGQTAPDFEANAFINGGFKNLRLSDFKGKWTVLCFYPGDFTFV